MEIDRLVKAYVRIRDERARISQEFEAADASLKESLSVIESALLEHAKETGSESTRTEYGTATRVVKEKFMIANADAMRTFVKEDPETRMELLQTRIHETNFKTWAAEHPDVTAPVNIERSYAIQVRRAS